MIILRNATIISGDGGAPAPGSVIMLNGGRIESVGAEADGYSANGADIVIDLKGRYVMPGFIDAHVHFGGADCLDYPGIGDRLETYDFLRSRVEALRWGVTTVRSAGDFTPDIFDFRDSVDFGAQNSPRIIAAGRMKFTTITTGFFRPRRRA